jgi:Alpha/beta hydrolase domain
VIPFTTTRAEREVQRDPRLSLAERYGSHAAYVQKVAAAAQTLVAERLLLPEDAARYVDEARQQTLLSRDMATDPSPLPC